MKETRLESFKKTQKGDIDSKSLSSIDLTQGAPFWESFVFCFKKAFEEIYASKIDKSGSFSSLKLVLEAHDELVENIILEVDIAPILFFDLDLQAEQSRMTNDENFYPFWSGEFERPSSKIHSSLLFEDEKPLNKLSDKLNLRQNKLSSKVKSRSKLNPNAAPFIPK